MRSIATRAVTAVVAVALALLAVATFLAVAAISNENAEVTSLRTRLAGLAELRDAVSDMAFAEASYRRAPSEDGWTRLEYTMDSVPTALGRIRGGLSRGDQLSLSNLGVLHLRYVNQITSTRGQPVTSGDDRVAGPALDAMRELLQAIIDRYRAATTAATEHQAALIHRMRLVLPAAFVLAFAVLGWAFTLSQRNQRRLAAKADDAESRALRDSLTGLPNRAALMAALSRASERDVEATSRGGGMRPRPALIMLDLDGFKPVNDSFGHPAGDLVLQQVAARLNTCVRTDDVAVRLGGDEFAVLVLDGASAQVVAERIGQVFGAPFEIDETTVSVGASMGLARAGAQPWTPDELLRAADAELYRSKRDRKIGE